MRAIICHQTIIDPETKQPRGMTDEEEDILAHGRNWEHSKASVQQSKMEELFRVMNYWNKFIADKKGAKWVCCFLHANTVNNLLTD